MSDVNAPTSESLQYQAEVRQLLHILAHSLYTDREIFLRELISNASDALNRLQFEMLTNQDVVGAEGELAIRIQVDTDAKTITVSDNGIGMNREELIENLGTIAHSGARAFLQSAGEKQAKLDEIIGQFGVGFYSAFMVADEITVTSRSYRPEDQAWTWQSQSGSTYTLSPAQKSDRGTVVHLKLKEDAHEFASAWRLEQIVGRHSEYVSFPIYVGDKVANRRVALWRQSAQEVGAEQYADFYKQLTLDQETPLLHLHLVTDAPVNLRSVLFVPSRRDWSLLGQQPDHGLELYSRKVLIQKQYKELLPPYYRFVVGVVDSEDIPLNISRETVQSNPLVRQIRQTLTNRLTRELKSLAEKQPETYAKFWKEFGIFVKEGIAIDPASHESLRDLLRFHSSQAAGDGLVSLKEFVERMAESQKAIYYVLGDDLKSVARSPHLDYFRTHHVEVLYLVDPIDGLMTTMLREYDGKPLQNVDDANLDLPEPEAPEPKTEEETLPQSDFDRLVERFKTVLGDRVAGVQASKRLVDNPCRLVSEDTPDRDLQRIRRLMGQDYQMPKKVLELNRSHPLVQNLAHILADRPEEALIDTAIEQLFDNARLLEGIHENPAEMAPRIQSLLEAAVAAQVDKRIG